MKRGFTPDKRPVVQVPRITRKRQTVFGTINLTGRITLAASESGTKATFLAFLQILQEEYADHDDIFVVLDGALYHNLTPSLQLFLRASPRIHFVYFPPHSPELNPVEQLWRLVRKKISGKYLETIEQVIDNVLNYDQTWRPSLCRKYQKICATGS